jgi:AraC-like DNA-binding protein
MQRELFDESAASRETADALPLPIDVTATPGAVPRIVLHIELDDPAPAQLAALAALAPPDSAARVTLLGAAPGGAPRPASHRPRTQPALDHVAAHYRDRIELATVARLCNLSASHFSRRFRCEHGVAFSRYLLEYRIGRACELLAGSARAIKDAAFSVGFNDLAYFSRAFRRALGVTPSAYQRGARSSNTFAGSFKPRAARS